MSRAPSRASSFAGSQKHEDGGLTALLGASTAFGRPTQNGASAQNDAGKVNAALRAANAAGGASKEVNPGSLRYGPPAAQTKGRQQSPVDSSMASSVTSSPSSSVERRVMKQQHLLVPNQGRPQYSRSPSQQAAVLAAASFAPAPRSSTKPSRSPTMGRTTLRRSNKPAAPPKPRRFSTHSGKNFDKPALKAPGTPSIPPTTLLVDFFERKAKSQDEGKQNTDAFWIKPSKDLPLRSPRPVRNSGQIARIFQIEFDGKPSATPLDADGIETKSLDADQSSDDEIAYVSASEKLSRSPATIRKRESPTKSPSVYDGESATESIVLEPSDSRVHQALVPPTAPVPIQRPPRKISSPAASSGTSLQSSRSLAAQWHTMQPKRQTPLTTGDSLANAMVASSLASSRAPSPTKLGPSPKARRKIHHGMLGRSPSPRKTAIPHAMRQTMRDTENSSSEDDFDDKHPRHRHRSKNIVRKHPHKHQEGDRKRWRDAVSDRERKRYEGVWAANKGLHVSLSKQANVDRHDKGTVELQQLTADEVSNIVTREIWARSRLPEQILEVVWNLVDSRELGRLSKQEFVVGMWLIDQRLKGRKLPAKVSESVWESVIGLGIKLRK